MSTTCALSRWFATTAFLVVMLLAGFAEAQRGRGGGERGGGDRERGGGERGFGGGGERGFGGGERGFGGGGERGFGGGERGFGGGGPGGDRRFGGGPGGGPGGAPGGSRGDFNRGGPGAPPSSSGGSSNPSSRGSSAGSGSVQGFGSGEKPSRASGFDVPLEASGGNLQDRYDKRVIDKADGEVMATFDTNKDGFLSAEEAEESDWDPPFADSDLDKDGRLSRFEMYERYAKKLNLPAKPAGAASAGGGSARPSNSGSGGGGDAAGYAKGYIKQHDSNQSGALEKDEWEKIKPEHREADTNKDGIITEQELTAKFASFGGSGSSGGSASASSSSGGSGGRRGSGGGRGEKGTAENRKSYRVPTATERLPKGLPDWFARNDTDADGQVTMSEYLTEPTDAKAAEFARYDLNGDGIITPEECLDSAKSSSGSSTARR